MFPTMRSWRVCLRDISAIAGITRPVRRARQPQVRLTNAGSIHKKPEIFMIGIGVIGYGYWGPNLARCANDASGTFLAAVADAAPAALAKARKRYPQIAAFENWRDLVADPRVDAVAIATPVRSHFEIAHGGHPYRGGRAARPRAHGRPHLRLHARGTENPPSH